MKVVTASVTAASALAAAGGQVRRSSDSSVRPTPRVRVALNSRKCQAAETLSQAKTIHKRLCVKWLKHFATFWFALAKAVCCEAQREERGVSYDVIH